MSDKLRGFRGRTIEQVQQAIFLRQLPAMGGRWRYGSAGLNADPGTLVLFQFKARIIASAVFLRDEKFDRPVRGSAGEIYFDPQSFRVFDPLDVQMMRKAWPSFRAFGHVKQHLNPARYPLLKRHLKHLMSPDDLPRRES
jgi:hypothetical protein